LGPDRTKRGTTRIFAGRLRLENAGADYFGARLDADATAFEKVGHRCESLAVAAAVRADCEDEVAECVVAICGFKGLFHGWNVLKRLR
jgi:hypothetical protein